jgi:protein gp37
MAERLKAMGVADYANGFGVTLQPKRLIEPLERRKPTVYFVNSMSDLFHEQVPAVFIEQVFDVIRRTPHHRYQVLTKRPKRMAEFFKECTVPLNSWMGVSVEDRKSGIPRIELLRNIDAAIRFLSIEPLLEPLGEFNLANIHWAIVGGESGPGARPMRVNWVRSIRDKCVHEGVPFFFKQWGAWGPDGQRRSKTANGRLLDGRIWNQFPEQHLA